jgi:sugar phosphate isomerase/epimerase
MSQQDVEDGAATFERIGRTCDALSDLGYPEVASALAQATRTRRGRIRGHVCPAKLAASLLELAEEADRLVAALSPAPRLCAARSPGGVVCERVYRHDGVHDWEPIPAELARA